MKNDDNGKHKTSHRAFSLLKTIGSTAVKAGNEALRKKFNIAEGEEFSVSQAALRLTKGLDELKGAAMKIGQLLSMMDEQMLPRGWKDALTKLQSEATARGWKEIEPILLGEWGSLSAFSAIENEALHAASIAQVHAAFLKDGKKVAIKVQYPDLEKNIKSDLQSMRKLVKVANIMPNMGNYDHIFLAAEVMFKQELDFEREKNFYSKYYSIFENHPNVIVPQPIEALCTPKILVTEWVDGVTLQKWLEQNPNQADRNGVAEAMLEVIFTEILIGHHIQSDPNPGNFLVTKDHKLVLLDFGATQTLSSELVQNYKQLFLAGLKQNRAAILRYSKKMGFIETGDNDDVRESFTKLILLALEPFLNETYDWAECQLSKRINAETFFYMKHTKYRAPKGDILFMNRRLGGNLLMLEKLNANFSARNVFLKVLEISEKELC